LGLPSRASLTVRVTDDSELRQLNLRFAGLDEPTDVLAFPGGDSLPSLALGARRVGDIAISVERAAAQNAQVAAELRLLAVHGLLHCIGFDHRDAAGAAAMTEQTRRLLPGEDVPCLG